MSDRPAVGLKLQPPADVPRTQRNLRILPTTIGSLGRNTIREPGEFNIDLSVSRRIRFTENVGFQLRGEAFNVLNRTNFNAPSSALNVTVSAAGSPFFNSPGFGLITSAKSARFIQLVARFEF